MIITVSCHYHHDIRLHYLDTRLPFPLRVIHTIIVSQDS